VEKAAGRGGSSKDASLFRQLSLPDMLQTILSAALVNLAHNQKIHKLAGTPRKQEI